MTPTPAPPPTPAPTTFYKTTRLDGTDFRTGAFDYAAALGSTLSVSAAPRPRCHTGSVLHASAEPTEALNGGAWPCRLFAVEGRPVARNARTRGFFALHVTDELDARLALGPNADEVTAVLRCTATLTPRQATQLATALAEADSRAWHAAGSVCGHFAKASMRHAAMRAAQEATRTAVHQAQVRAASSPAAELGVDSETWRAAAAAARAATTAALVGDLITEKHYGTLSAPWEALTAPAASSARSPSIHAA